MLTFSEYLPLSLLFEVFQKTRYETENCPNMCVYLSKNHGMTMSVEKKENDLTAKESNRISG